MGSEEKAKAIRIAKPTMEKKSFRPGNTRIITARSALPSSKFPFFEMYSLLLRKEPGWDIPYIFGKLRVEYTVFIANRFCFHYEIESFLSKSEYISKNGNFD